MSIRIYLEFVSDDPEDLKSAMEAVRNAIMAEHVDDQQPPLLPSKDSMRVDDETAMHVKEQLSKDIERTKQWATDAATSAATDEVTEVVVGFTDDTTKQDRDHFLRFLRRLDGYIAREEAADQGAVVLRSDQVTSSAQAVVSKFRRVIGPLTLTLVRTTLLQESALLELFRASRPSEESQ